jgi:hypothetical protein
MIVYTLESNTGSSMMDLPIQWGVASKTSANVSVHNIITRKKDIVTTVAKHAINKYSSKIDHNIKDEGYRTHVICIWLHLPLPRLSHIFARIGSTSLTSVQTINRTVCRLCNSRHRNRTVCRLCNSRHRNNTVQLQSSNSDKHFCFLIFIITILLIIIHNKRVCS